MPLQWVFLAIVNLFKVSLKTALSSASDFVPKGNSVYLRAKYKRHESA